MTTLGSIVTATDLSAHSRHAAARAAMLARRTQSGVVLVHAIGGTALEDLRRWLAGDTASPALVEAHANESLNALAADIARLHDIQVRTELVVGSPVEEVTRLASEMSAGLLVTGTRGAGFFKGIVTGSTAERLAKRSERPVLMVRQLPRDPYRRVLIPVDFSPWSQPSITLARTLAPEATLVLMHAVEVPFEGKLRLAGVSDEVVQRYRTTAREEARQRMSELAIAAGLNPANVDLLTPCGADPWMHIVQLEQEQDCDLVVIGRQGRNALNELLLGSTTRMVLAEGSGDVLISVGRGE